MDKTETTGGADSLIAILVVSCDNYADLWFPFSRLLKKFWPHCPYPLYLLSNDKEFHEHQFKVIKVGTDVSWSDNLRKALEQIPNEYILLFLDDLFLYDYVKSEKLAGVEKWIREAKPNCVIMDPAFRPDKPFNEHVGIVSKGAIYRTSTVMSVWKKEILYTLLNSSESAWHFEIDGSVRSDAYDGFYAGNGMIFPVMNSVIKGRWHPQAISKAKQVGIDVDISSRLTMSSLESFYFWLKKQRSKVLCCVPSQYRRKTKDFFLMGKYSYQLTEPKNKLTKS